MINTRGSRLVGCLQEAFATLLKKHRPSRFRSYFMHDPFGLSANAEKPKVTPSAPPYLISSAGVAGKFTGGSTKQTLNFPIFIALFVILIALINFVHLSIARSAWSIGEVDLEKVAGAIKRGVIKQYFTNLFIKNIIDILLSVLLVISSMNFFNQLVGISVLSFDMWIGPEAWFTMLFILLIGSIVAGTYPSNTIPGFKRNYWQGLAAVK